MQPWHAADALLQDKEGQLVLQRLMDVLERWLFRLLSRALRHVHAPMQCSVFVKFASG